MWKIPETGQLLAWCSQRQVLTAPKYLTLQQSKCILQSLSGQVVSITSVRTLNIASHPIKYRKLCVFDLFVGSDIRASPLLLWLQCRRDPWGDTRM